LILPYTQEAYQLFHEGAIALAEVEHNGIRIDTEYLDNAIATQTARIERLKNRLQKSEVTEIWKNYYKGRTNLNSNDQLGYVLFEIMKYECPELTATGRFKTDEDNLSLVDHPFVKDYLKIKKLEKSLATNLIGIRREVVDGFMHPFFNLHTTVTFRSSSDSPNFQNIPVRNESVKKLVRQAIIARPGRRIVELDYSGIEVAIAACYHKDPTMMSYLKDKSKDMHRDMAMQSYMMPIEEMTNPISQEDNARIKKIRYCGKNMFVFPQFYGDWFLKCAKNLWNAMIQLELKKRDGTPFKEHLYENGITELGEFDPRDKPKKGTFIHHLQEVEKDFWNVRFPIYNKWRKDWFYAYQEKGWMLTKTGFICQGMGERNQIINYPVQGSAFHCLLKSLITLQNRLKKLKMKSLIIGQIHDSIVSDVPDEELDDFLHLAHQITVDELKQQWKWIIAPLEIEAEVTPVDGNWYQKKEMKIE